MNHDYYERGYRLVSEKLLRVKEDGPVLAGR